MAIRFLTLDEAMLIHAESMAKFGGSQGLRDVHLLQSAMAMPASGFGGDYLHEFPHGMAAAYLFHVAANHPFIDGNKRTALMCALMFLDVNGYVLAVEKPIAQDMVLAVASGQMEKNEVAAFFERHVRPV